MPCITNTTRCTLGSGSSNRSSAGRTAPSRSEPSSSISADSSTALRAAPWTGSSSAMMSW
ncbi:hypothetical protein EER27_05410 [Lysobacter psychrotolerans]|uniref:Uncharacterized protein n=1 Tax=Montanilutibacter psychrotolerans TaxID=1327343 RepID=A0A3M8T257_9GAMM|nr:hypothetical protein EER27_05410 [Lysobacter psychrotolerans]